MWRVRGTLEPLGQPGQESAARAELRVAHTDPGSVADLVDLVEQVENVEAQLEPFVEARLDRLNNTEIHLLVAGQVMAVRDSSSGHAARGRAPDAAAGGEVGGAKGTGRRHSAFDPGRGCIGLIVI